MSAALAKLISSREQLLRHIVVLLLSVSLAGCLTQLAPDYDKAIVDAVTSANEAGMKVLAAASAGTSAGTFSHRQADYDTAIGKLESLRLLVATRPTPPRHAAAIAALKKLPGAAGIDPADFAAPTVFFVQHMADEITEMRDRDRRIGLRPEIVALYKSQFEFEMVNTLTYEKALQR
ncbi:MAG TPA: hypothetical protein VFB16_09735 [Bauldia sp.]|nr:hypothetical protein [Bauldia sp.]